jgi:predicted aspartyl protease
MQTMQRFFEFLRRKNYYALWLNLLNHFYLFPNSYLYCGSKMTRLQKQNLLGQLLYSIKTKIICDYLCTVLLFLLIPLTSFSQNIYGLKKPIEIPFEYHNDFMIVKVLFNKTLPLNFVFDTGAEHTILAKKEIAEVLDIPYERRIQIVGSDMKEDLYAYLARRIHLKIGEINIPNQSILVLEEDYFEFEKRVGVEIEGILGADFFKAYRLSINYDTKTIKLSPSSPKIPRGYDAVPVEIHKNKPYVNSVLELSDTTTVSVKLLLDTGAGLALLLHTDTHPDLELPNQVIPGEVGVGLGGTIPGFLGRVKRLPFEDCDLQMFNVVTNFQKLNSDLETSQLNERNGIIGNEILSRFQVVIDYPQQKLFLKANRRYKRKFEFDRSGLILLVAGEYLNEYYISKVVPNSPASEVGLFRGDRIMGINGTSTSLMNLEGILQRLKRKPGKKIRLVLSRRGTKMRRHFILRDLI